MIVDLRSDTLTKATPEMMDAMMKGTLGDDVFDEDQTVHKLQDRAAELVGASAALYVVSGTMANQLAIASQTRPHDEVIIDSGSHIFQFEQGAPAVISGVQMRAIDFEDGLPSPDQLDKLIRFPDIHHARSKLLCLEVTHNANGGAIPDLEKLEKVCKRAKELGLKVHIDGARIWNAVVKTGKPIKWFFDLCDTMMFCFSKGLGTPIGSVLMGSKETIKEAHYLRKGLGGGWRQPGMLAAACLYALDNNIDRLEEDHKRAKKIGEAISSNPKLKLLNDIDTNMIYFTTSDGSGLEPYAEKLEAKGVLHDWKHFNKIRLVTYLNLTDEMVDYVCDAIASTSLDF